MRCYNEWQREGWQRQTVHRVLHGVYHWTRLAIYGRLPVYIPLWVIVAILNLIRSTGNQCSKLATHSRSGGNLYRTYNVHREFSYESTGERILKIGHVCQSYYQTSKGLFFLGAAYTLSPDKKWTPRTAVIASRNVSQFKRKFHII